MYKHITVKFRREKPESYDIITGITLKEIAADIVKNFNNSRLFIITDTNVLKLYGKTFSKYLKKIGADVHILKIKAGENSKTREIKENLEDKILEIGATRKSVIIALGGGVVGDVAGFIAATLNRGVPFIQIPTTLLSQIDSAIGGKVAVNHPKGKNLIGAFYHPKVVYIDVATLKTLDGKEFRNGIAEAIKYGAVLDRKLFEFISKNREKILQKDINILTHLIHTCCGLKAKVVKLDELEKSFRRILNFGHTVGHALEQLSSYKIPHGEAVAIGMVAEAKFSVFLQMLDIRSLNKLILLLADFGLPVTIKGIFSIDRICKAIQSDKKAGDGLINFTLLNSIGSGVHNIPINNEDIKKMLRAL